MTGDQAAHPWAHFLVALVAPSVAHGSQVAVAQSREAAHEVPSVLVLEALAADHANTTGERRSVAWTARRDVTS